MSGFFALDPAGVREAACQGLRGSYDVGQRARALRQARRVLDLWETAPKTCRRCWFVIGHRRCELVLEHGADRRLEACHDVQRRKDRRIGAWIRRRREQHCERLGFRLEPGQPSLDPALRFERRMLLGKAAGHLMLGGDNRGPAFLDPPLRLGERGRCGSYCFGRYQCGGQCPALPFGRVAPCFQTRPPVGELASAFSEGGVARLGGSGSFGRTLQCHLGLDEAGRRFVQAIVGHLPCRIVFRTGSRDQQALLGQSGDGSFRLGEALVLALQVTRELGAPPIGFAACGEHPLQFLFEFAASMGEPMQLGRGRRLGDPQRRQHGLSRLVGALLGERSLRRLADGTLRGAKRGGRVFGLGFGRAPASVEQQRFGAPDVLAEATVALRLTRLLIEGLKLGLDRRDDVVEP